MGLDLISMNFEFSCDSANFVVSKKTYLHEKYKSRFSFQS